jgi:hypothetical protein
MPRFFRPGEAIKEAEAYNLCLASFGPVRGQHGATYPGVASEGDKADRATDHGKGAARRATPTLGHGARLHHGANGRVQMEFSPGRR